MKVITALTAQKKHQDRVNVFLDGAFAFGLPLAAATKLKVDQTLSDIEIEALKKIDLLDKVKNSAIRLISYRPRSEAEVQRHLVRKGYDEQLITTVITQLRKIELIDDMAFSRYWVDQRETFKPRSRMALQYELRQKGVDRDIIEATLIDLDETAAARRAAEKKIRPWINLSEQEFRKKLGGFLQRRGFHYGIIKQITNELWHTWQLEMGSDNDAHS